MAQRVARGGTGNSADEVRSRRQRTLRVVRGKSIQEEQQVDVAGLLRELDESYLECRDIQHSWEKIGYFDEGKVRVRLQRCTRCGASKRLSMSSNGAILGSRYEYPAGYQLKDVGKGGVSKQDVRVAAMGHATVYASEAQLMASITKTRRR